MQTATTATTPGASAAPAAGRRAGAKKAAARPKSGPPARKKPAASPAGAFDDAKLRELCAPYGRDFYHLATQGRTAVSSDRNKHVLSRHQLGEIVDRAYARNEDGRDGAASISRVLAYAWDTTPEMIRKLRRIYLAYTRDQVATFLAIRNNIGMPLPWAFFEFAAEISDWNRRLAALRKAAAQGLTANEFGKLFPGDVADARGGRPAGAPARPASLAEVVRQIDRRASALVDYADDDVLEHIGELADDVPPDKVTDEQIAAVDAARWRLAAARAKAEAVERELAAALDRLSRRRALAGPGGAKPGPGTPPPAGAAGGKRRLEPGLVPPGPAPPIVPKPTPRPRRK